MKLPSLPLLVLDTETTGFVPVIHRVIEYACAVVKDGKVVKEYEQLLAGADNEVPPIVQVLTQIRPKDLEGKPKFADIFQTIAAMLTKDTVVVGQNIPFDLRMLKGEGWDMTAVPWIDTAMLASIVYPELKSYSLGYMSETLGLMHEPKHRALGDVRATVQMLGLCTERLESLPEGDLHALKDLAKRGPEGYKRFFSTLESSNKKTKRPDWLSLSKHSGPEADDRTIPATTLPVSKLGTVQVLEESFHPAVLLSIIAGAKKGTMIAVKNLDATLRRIELPEDIVVLPSPDALLSLDAAEKFLQKKSFTADELTLAMKLMLYHPKSKIEIPIHGDEYAVWAAVLGASDESPEYVARRKKLGTATVLVGHHEMISIASEDRSPISKATSLVIDDASMLEDTATSALGWTCLIGTLRAAASASDEITKCVDLIELWVEKVRGGTDLRYLAPSDLQSDEVDGLRTVIKKLLKTDLPHAPRRALDDLLLMFELQNLDGRITWIESFMDGNKAIKSVPEKIAEALADLLYSRVPTTLLAPVGSAKQLQTVISLHTESVTVSLAALPKPGTVIEMPIGFSLDQAIATATGKTVILVGSKRTIEDMFVKYSEACEKKGVTMLCQGFSGGQSRMQAEFTVAHAPAILVVTPWMYETMELASGTIQRLIMQTMPFDHPSHAVFSRRALRYQDPFGQYSLPRLLQRLFRLIRTFRRHSAPGAVVEILDDRLRTKAYGKTVSNYLLLLDAGSEKKQSESKASQLSLL